MRIVHGDGRLAPALAGWLYLLTDAQDGQLLRVTATP